MESNSIINRPISSTSAVCKTTTYHNATNSREVDCQSDAIISEYHSIKGSEDEEREHNGGRYRRAEFTLDQMMADVVSDISATTILGNGFVSMREQDAELLESMQLINSESIVTPVLTSKNHSGSEELLHSVPTFSLEQQTGSETSETKLTENSKNLAKQHRRSRTGSTTLVGLPVKHPTAPPVREHSDSFVEHATSSGSSGVQFSRNNSLRKALSGEVWTSSEPLDEKCAPKSLKMIDNTLLFRSVSSSSSMRRSDSVDRFMCEAAQFAEAIGEELAKNQDLQIIDDDDDRDLSDDEEEGVGTLLRKNPNSNEGFGQANVEGNRISVERLPVPKKWSYDDRRVNEVVQFAEAVGEFDVALNGDPNNTIQIIDDDDNEARFDDEDDEATEANVTCQHDLKAKDPSSVLTASFLSVSGPNRESKDSKFIASGVISHAPDVVIPHKPTHQNRFRGCLGCRGKTFLDKLPDNYNSAPATAKQLDFVYKGIQSNPPEIVKRGITRGNYAQLHRKAWLEVSDKYHRYGKNLRLYYRYWESLGFPTNVFFDWLDSKGDSAGQPLPELEECPRSKLDSDTVLYVTNPQVTQSYRIDFIPTKSFVDGITSSSTAESTTESSRPIMESTAEIAQNQLKTTKNQSLRKGLVVDNEGNPVRTGSDGWIFVLRDNEMYGAPKVTSVATTGQQGHATRQQRFHHSSFFGGKAVAAAGIFITDDEGILSRLYPHSGHYRPGEAHMQRVLFYLYHKGIDLRTFEMDIQQILHVDRGGDQVKDKTKKKKDKKESLQKEGTSAGSASSNIRKSTNMNDVTAATIHSDNNHATDVVATTEKKKKVESLHLLPAILVACFLAHKARFVGEGIFSQIHKIRRRGPEITSVTEALNIIDGGGCYWSGSASATTGTNNHKTSCSQGLESSDSTRNE